MLSHLSDDALRFGALDNFSAFPFENYLGQLKKLVRTPNKPLQQICRRLHELDNVSLDKSQSTAYEPKLQFEHVNGPVLKNFQKQFKRVSLSNYILCTYSSSVSDSYCFTNEYVIQVENIVTNTNSEKITVIGKYFKHMSSFYQSPFESKLLNIYLVSDLSEEYKSCLLTDIKGKCFLMPYKTEFVSIPLYHTNC